MNFPAIVFDPPFRITRASHVVLTARDLAASRRFYCDLIGLVLTEEDGDTLYLRGIEEACHHSLVIRRAAEPECLRIGMRVQTEDDLDRAIIFFASKGCEVEWSDVTFQGRTLHATDVAGVPLELCASMTMAPRMITAFSSHKGGCAQRLDHCQILAPNVRAVTEFYMAAGFRPTEYIAPTGTDELLGVFLQRKGNPHDIVFFNGAGPRLHHVAYLASETRDLLRACDIAGELGFGAQVERGPGRHGPGHALYVYFRDPDGHRVELFNTHYQVMDMENEPVGWDPSDPKLSYPWGLPAQQSWFQQATPFAGTPVHESAHEPNPTTLESFLAKP